MLEEVAIRIVTVFSRLPEALQVGLRRWQCGSVLLFAEGQSCMSLSETTSSPLRVKLF